MAIYKTAISKPITTGLLFVAVIVLGLFSLTRLPIDQMPEMDPPYVTVMTTYAGANASEIETNITKLVENSLNSVDGLKNITSTSKDNISVVSLEFEWGSDIDEALNDIRSFVDLLYDNLPDGVSRPMILKLNSSAMPIMVYGFTAKESYSGLDRILEDNVVNELNRVDGIGNITVSGAPERYVYIDLDPKQLDAYGLSLEQVGTAISSNNLDLASGTVKMGKEQYQMRVKGEYVESSEIADIAVALTPTGKQIFVRDLATVRDTIKDLSLDEKINRQDGARLIITKQTGANTVAIARAVKAQMQEIQKTLPPDIQTTLIRDASEEIVNAINGLTESIFYALLFVVLVVLIFLGNWRSTLIIALTIPISLVTSFIYLLLADSSLNIISLASLTVAIGMVVDDAIVVLENITKHIERGESPREAAICATNEVWTSVIATTLVLVAVFVPLTMLPGMMGIFMKELGWIVTIVVCVSTTAAITLIPMLSSKMLKEKPFFLTKEAREEAEAKKASKRITYENTIGKTFNAIEAAYANLLRWCLKHKRSTLLFFAAIFIVSIIPIATGTIGMDFMKEQDNGRISVTAELQRGTRIEETLKTARHMEDDIYRILGDDVIVVSTSAGSNDDAGMSALFNSTTNNKISMTIRCTKKYDRKKSVLRRVSRAHQLPGEPGRRHGRRQQQLPQCRNLRLRLRPDHRLHHQAAPARDGQCARSPRHQSQPRRRPCRAQNHLRQAETGPPRPQWLHRGYVRPQPRQRHGCRIPQRGRRGIQHRGAPAGEIPLLHYRHRAALHPHTHGQDHQTRRAGQDRGILVPAHHRAQEPPALPHPHRHALQDLAAPTGPERAERD